MTAEESSSIAALEKERRWLLVRTSGSVFAFELESVREVIPARPCTRIPGAPPYVRGLLNLRGQLLTVVDLKAFLGGGSAAGERQARVLVVASRDAEPASA